MKLFALLDCVKNRTPVLAVGTENGTVPGQITVVDVHDRQVRIGMTTWCKFESVRRPRRKK